MNRSPQTVPPATPPAPEGGVAMIGGGQMALALAEGFHRAGLLAPADITVYDPHAPALERLAARCGLADRVAFRGAVPNGVVQEALAGADCAILPSRFDGWGMLVNESLAAGTPVICTTACGAALLVSSARLGSVVQPDSVAALRASLAYAIERGSVQPKDRAGIHADASAGMSATWAAARFDSLLADAGLPLASFARVES